MRFKRPARFGALHIVESKLRDFGSNWPTDKALAITTSAYSNERRLQQK
jgi:hypothetical protein